ncbi:hypothetical protein ACPA9J_11345 [Pseudomonas aeruginosa]
MTDAAADALRPLFQGLARLTDAAPGVTAESWASVPRWSCSGGSSTPGGLAVELMDVARGRSMMGNPNIVQRVFVTNPGAGGGW